MRPTFLHSTIAALLATLLAACATTSPAPIMRRDAPAEALARSGTAPGAGTVEGVGTEPLTSAEGADPRPVIRRGTGQVINRAAASAPPPSFGGSSGEARFNFEGESLHAVVRAILGDMLGQNYVIAPGVQGTVTYVTARPVSAAEALSLLEMILGWNNARMVYSDGRYSITAADAPLAGSVAPRIGPTDTVRGYESRVVPLRYISAEEMKKILEPYARPNAIVNADPGRNVITIAGSRTELENYLRTIATFDVDWMSSMSVGVFPLRSGRAGSTVAALEKVFGESGNSPVAGMFRFMPLEEANAVLVISTQPDYMDDIQDWLDRIDSAGGGLQLYSYELQYITAKDLAERLAQVYGGGSQRSDASADGFSLMPGLESTTIKDSGIDGDGISSAAIGAASGLGSEAGGGLGSGGSGFGSGASLGQREGGDASVSFEVDGSEVGVSAVDETNSLLVRSTPQAWRSIREVIEKLDVMPLQVHIEAQLAEVTLSGDLSYGVNWFFQNPAGATLLPDGFGVRQLTGVGGVAYTFVNSSLSAGAILSALDEVSDVRMLSSPSLMVRNNEEASLTDGTKIPINSLNVNPIEGDNSFSQVQYLDTGIILRVRPRLTKDGTVFLDLVSEVSTPGDDPDQFGNVRISNRSFKTTTMLQSGDTTMIAGLIQDSTSRASGGFPGLSRIPIIGGLFGQQSTNKVRSEVILLLTPTLVRDGREARELTDEYSRRFRAMEPLRRQPGQD